MYQPLNVPDDAKALAAFLRLELTRIAQELNGVTSIELPTLYAAPTLIKEGMVVKADGATWNPGGGAGLYARVSGAWVKL